MKPVIRDAAPRDAPVLEGIERQSFANPNWNANSFLRYKCTVAELDGRVVGFLVSRETLPGTPFNATEREILNLAVAGEYRRSGIAMALLTHELSRPGTYFLEVRESNAPAQALYRKCGFVEIGRRPGYYEHPAESAIVMRLQKC